LRWSAHCEEQLAEQILTSLLKGIDSILLLLAFHITTYSALLFLYSLLKDTDSILPILAFHVTTCSALRSLSSHLKGSEHYFNTPYCLLILLCYFFLPFWKALSTISKPALLPSYYALLFLSLVMVIAIKDRYSFFQMNILSLLLGKSWPRPEPWQRIHEFWNLFIMSLRRLRVFLSHWFDLVIRH
jgi:hypothetical protein